MISTTKNHIQSWSSTFHELRNPSVLTMLFLGFSAGIPLLLIFSSLSLWLNEAGIERQYVTFFSWAALGYSFKFVWAPLIDKIPLIFLTRKMGKRRSWLLLAQLLIMLSIVLMGSIDPTASDHHKIYMALAAVMLGFSAATQDIVIDAYRIEIAKPRLQAMMSASYIAGYRIGMIVSGAGALYIASWLGTEKGHYIYHAWQWTYYCMAAVMSVGLATTLIISEPQSSQLSAKYQYSTLDYSRLILVFILSITGFVLVFFYSGQFFSQLHTYLNNEPFLGFFIQALRFLLSICIAVCIGWLLIQRGLVNRDMANDTWVRPIDDFIQRYGIKTAILLLTLIGLYRITDIVPGVISNLFYQDMGFSKPEIATAVKTVGVVISIVGGFSGGVFATRYGVMRTMMLGAILTAFTNLVFVWLSYVGHDTAVMYIAVTADNLAGGFASAAFIAFLSSLTSVSFTAVQYAIFSSLMTLLPKTIGGYSGTIVDNIGYPGFFIFTTLIGIPVLWLVWKTGKVLKAQQHNNSVEKL